MKAKNKISRLLVVLLAIMMVLSLMPITVMAADDVAIDESNFPDEAFRQYVKDNFDTDGNGVLSEAEIAKVRKIDVNSKNISSLKGVEYFTAITWLDCQKNQLTELDVSANKNLSYLYCSNNRLTSIKFGENTALIGLYCEFNKLTSLDVSGCTGLGRLWCSSNGITSLDTSKNTHLYNLSCGQNKLTKLDVSNNTALKDLNCAYNQLTSLDLSNNKSLEYLNCGYNQLISLDVSNNTKLTELGCYQNQLKSINVDNNIALTVLEFGGNPISSVNLSNNTALETFSCYNCQLTSLDLSNNTALTYLNCNNNQLTSLDLSNTKVETRLQCRDNSYEITLNADRTFDLSTLPKEFVVSRASNWQGATVNGTILKADVSASKATYEYYLGNRYVGNDNDIAVFTLTFIPHTHSYGDWEYNADEHWKKCICKNEIREEHDIEIIGAKKETTTEPGYTGDKVCKVCGYTEEGEEIPAHTHGYGDWKSDKNNHWKECDCGEKSEAAVHDFEVVNAKDATDTETGYTGDKVCKVCGYTEKGEEIPATGTGDITVPVEDIIDIFKQIFSQVDIEMIRVVFEQSKDIIDKIIDIIVPLFDFSDSPSEPTTEPGTDDSTGTTDTDSSTQVPVEDDSIGDSDTDALVGNSGTGVPNTGAISGITAFAALSVAAAAAFVSKKKKS